MSLGDSWDKGRRIPTPRTIDRAGLVGAARLTQVQALGQSAVTGRTSGDSAAARAEAAVMRRRWCRRHSTS